MRNRIQEASDEIEKMAGTEGKYGIGAVAAGLAVIGRDRPKLAVGLALIVAGVGLVADGAATRFLKSMGMA
ncbi:hypothetical protein GRX03_14255 [Halovenus sp. WSH3]|uniref:Uncharacterized protein n=1 Tax=Halovenus carboxidivorans TaxID=2692199 RepID=A0A6B0TAX1_9EURY|nr:hypothetical protein [Halovenus carboxidivorans]MXR52763.1 hypothetical protein [Halovenus carboxidivorans]